MILQYGADRVTEVHFWLGDTQGDTGWLFDRNNSHTYHFNQSIINCIQGAKSKLFKAFFSTVARRKPSDPSRSDMKRLCQDEKRFSSGNKPRADPDPGGRTPAVTGWDEKEIQMRERQRQSGRQVRESCSGNV